MKLFMKPTGRHPANTEFILKIPMQKAELERTERLVERRGRTLEQHVLYCIELGHQLDRIFPPELLDRMISRPGVADAMRELKKYLSALEDKPPQV